MSQMVLRFTKPLIVKMMTDFLHQKNYQNRLESLVKKKIERLSQVGIGKKLGITRSTPIEKVPLTAYNFYFPFYKNPHEGDFMYPLAEYIRNQTSGTMSRPKVYLTPRKGILKNLKTTVPSILFISSYDGEKYQFNFGDTIYTNLPSIASLSSTARDTLSSKQSTMVRMVPEQAREMSFQQKVDYFVENYRQIDVAYMTITTLLDEIHNRIDGPIPLKSFITTDISAAPLKERIKDITGTYPSTLFGSTEMMVATVPSREYPGGFIFDWRVVYPEFIPLDRAVDIEIDSLIEFEEVIPCSEVEVGKRYQIVATPFYNDITRYVMSDVLECTSLGDDVLNTNLPVFSYYARSDHLIVLHNFTRINEEELVKILADAKIPFVDFTTRMELDGSRDYMVLYIEFSDDISVEEATKRINEHLKNFDKDWRDLITMLKYIPLKVVPLAKGSFRNFLKKKSGTPKVTRIGMRDDRFKLLINQ